MRDLSIVLLLILLPLGVFWQTGQFGFVNYDDGDYVYENPQVLAGLSAENVRWSFSSTLHHWHPLTWLSLMLDTELYDGRPGGYHRTNVLLHVLNGLLLFAALRRATGASWRSFFVAALFAVHPLRVESVAWVSERKDVLSACFGLGALYAYIRFVEGRRAGWYAMLLASWIASLLAKQTLVTLPFALLLIDFWPLGRLSDAIERRRAVIEKIPLYLTTIGFSVAAFVGLSSAGAVQSTAKVPLAIRVANAAWSYAGYLAATVWPRGLAPYYPYPKAGPPTTAVVVSVALLAAITLGAWLVRRRRPYVLVGWCWYLGTLVPVIGLIQLGSYRMADRYTYLPLIGIFVAVVWLAADLAPAGALRSRLLPGLGAALLAALAVTAHAQTGRWQDSETLFRHAIAVTRNNDIAHYNLGTWLGMAGRIDEALPHLEQAVAIDPLKAEAHANLANALLASGQIERAHSHLRQSIALDAQQIAAHMTLGFALQQLGRPEEAIASFRRGLALEPNNQRAIDTVAQAHYQYGLALLRAGQTDAAIGQLSRALEVAPNLTPAREALDAARNPGF